MPVFAFAALVSSLLLPTIAKPPPAGSYDVSSGSFQGLVYPCAGPATTNIWYPTQLEQGPFPIASFGHGTGGQMLGDLLNSIASLGFVVVAPVNGNCPEHWKDILYALDGSKGNTSLHKALNQVDWKRTGILGHSFGGAHGMAAATEAVKNPDQHVPVKAVVASHGFSDAANLTIPSMFTSGHEDRRGKAHGAFKACPAKRKVFAVVEGAGHMEPMHGGRLNPFDAHFLGCHVADLHSSCDKIYGDSDGSICRANVMSACEVAIPSPTPPSPSTCSIQNRTDCSSGYFNDIDVDTFDHCCDLCKGDSRCGAWTHYQGTCYLKRACGNATSKDGCTSGTMAAPGPTPPPSPTPPLPPSKCDFKQGIDYDTGSTSGKHDASTKEECCALCADDDACAAAVFRNGCWLKTADQISKQVKKPDAIACVPKAPPPAPPAPSPPAPGTCNVLAKIDCRGDFYSEARVDAFDACCDLCKADAACMAWTHSVWNDRGKRQATCYLKKACGIAASDNDCTSGTMNRTAIEFMLV